MAASRPGAIDGARAHARRSARDIATISQHRESAVWPAVFAHQAKQEGGIGEGGSPPVAVHPLFRFRRDSGSVTFLRGV